MNTTIRYGRRTIAAAVAALGMLAAVASAALASDGKIPAAVAGALVQVEVDLQTDGGDEPSAPGWTTRCPNCGSHHDTDVSAAMREQRPLRAPGILTAPNRVVMIDPQLETRFVRAWRVRFGNELVEAKVAALAIDQPALALALDRPLPGARPLTFGHNAREARTVVTCTSAPDGFMTTVQSLSDQWIHKGDGRRFRPVAAPSVLLGARGEPVALCMSEELPETRPQSGAPDQWAWLSIEDYERKLTALRGTVDATVLRAALRYRERPAQPGAEEPREFARNSDGPPTQALAVAVSPQRALVLAALKPGATARLEEVRLVLPDGTERPAQFFATVAELGAFLVETPSALPGGLVTADTPWHGLRQQLLLSARIKVQGEQRTAKLAHARLSGVGFGPKDRLVPAFPGEAADLFVFDLSGRLLGLPAIGRPIASLARWSPSESRSSFTQRAGELAVFSGSVGDWADPRNAPQSAADERRLAWLGAELQPLNKELAAVHLVANQIGLDEFGALIAHVYPGSPAARAGLRSGDVLLRIRPKGAAKPVALRLRPSGFGMQPFPWERLDEVPEPFFERIPAPWAPAENEFTDLLKDLGFGASYGLDYAREGQPHTVQLVVEPGPAHFATAQQLADSSLGLSVRELTFETRRYYQIPEGEPGLLVSRVEPGSRAAVAGVKPFELVVSVNGNPIRQIADFRSATAPGGAFQIGIRRMHRARVVSIADRPMP